MRLKEIMRENTLFTRKNRDRLKKLSSIPRKQLAVVTCMDTRLVDFLEPALGLKRGDAKIIKNAGNTVRSGCDDLIRSLVTAIYLMGVQEVLVVGHLDCGASKIDIELLKNRMLEHGIKQEEIDKFDLAGWMGGFQDSKSNVVDTVKRIRTHPLFPQKIPVHGLLICPDYGELQIIIDGYSESL